MAGALTIKPRLTYSEAAGEEGGVTFPAGWDDEDTTIRIDVLTDWIAALLKEQHRILLLQRAQYAEALKKRGVDASL